MLKLIKTIVILNILFFNINLFSQVDLKVIPKIGISGQTIYLFEDSTIFFQRQLIDIKLNDLSIKDNIINKNNNLISINLPNELSGNYILKVEFDDNAFGEVVYPIVVEEKDLEDYIEETVDGSDPDPNTQNGEPSEYNKITKIPFNNDYVFNPKGGNRKNKNFKCIDYHKIDGFFTDSIVNNSKEWVNIIPLKGRFSHLYMDFCSESEILYLINDWYNGAWEYDSSNCYNRFEFQTENGKFYWVIKVYHNLTKPLEVFRNNVDVTNDTNIVIGGTYSYNKSLLVDSLHTIYEFGIKSKSGIFIMPGLEDPVGPPPRDTRPKVFIECDKDGIEGYGLVKEPKLLIAKITDEGIRYKLQSRYIKNKGFKGLKKSKNLINGVIDTLENNIFIGNDISVSNHCTSNHFIDGKFTNINNNIEWDSSANIEEDNVKIYTDYCNNELHFLIDFKKINSEPEIGQCYSIFELFTYNYDEHWMIAIKNNNEDVIVFKNGEDVTFNNSEFLGGKYSFTEDIENNTKSTKYEFGIKTNLGTWNLNYTHPDNLSFCDDKNLELPRLIDNINYGIRNLSLSPDKFGQHDEKINLFTNTLNLALSTNLDNKLIYSKQLNFVIKFVNIVLRKNKIIKFFL